MSNYEENQARKLAAAQKKLVRVRAEAEDAYKRSRQLGDMIPMGQPILVGHHSERGHRNLLEKIHNLGKKHYEKVDEAKSVENRISNLENPYAISSDDPEAVKKLKERYAKVDKEHQHWKSFKPNPDAGMYDHDGAHWRRLEVESLSRQKRDIKKRIDLLNAESKIVDSEKMFGDIKLVIDKGDNRVRLLFPDKPSEEIRSKLKHNGFRWSPYNKAWQRMANGNGIWAAERLAKEFQEVKA